MLDIVPQKLGLLEGYDHVVQSHDHSSRILVDDIDGSHGRNPLSLVILVYAYLIVPYTFIFPFLL